MNNIIKAVATAMIVILIVVLIWIFLSYYENNGTIDAITFSSGNSNVSTLNIPSGNYLDEQNNNLNSNESLIESIIKNSSDIQGPNASTDNQNSGDIISENEISGDNMVNEQTNAQSEQQPNEENNQSGNNPVNQDPSGENNVDRESPGNTNSGETIPDTIIEIPGETENDPGQIIISSDSQTSNQQKQEILTEIDKALQGLLEAVRKVEIVDEERLDVTLNSEVDEP